MGAKDVCCQYNLWCCKSWISYENLASFPSLLSSHLIENKENELRRSKLIDAAKKVSTVKCYFCNRRLPREAIILHRKRCEAKLLNLLYPDVQDSCLSYLTNKMENNGFEEGCIKKCFFCNKSVHQRSFNIHTKRCQQRLQGILSSDQEKTKVLGESTTSNIVHTNHREWNSGVVSSNNSSVKSERNEEVQINFTSNDISSGITIKSGNTNASKSSNNDNGYTKLKKFTKRSWSSSSSSSIAGTSKKLKAVNSLNHIYDHHEAKPRKLTNNKPVSKNLNITGSDTNAGEKLKITGSNGSDVRVKKVRGKYDKSNSNNTDKNHVCHICGHKFKRKWDMKRHTKIHIHKNTYPCRHCDKSFKYSGFLKTHMEAKHPRESPSGS